MTRKRSAWWRPWRLFILFGAGVSLGVAAGIWWAPRDATRPLAAASSAPSDDAPNGRAADGPPAGTPSSRALLIEASELQSRLGENGLRIVDTRPRQAYLESHLPGAVWVDVADWQQLGERAGGFQDRQAWGRRVGQLGIEPDADVVVYGDALPDAARIWWTLKYLGVARVTLLNGGWQAWQQASPPTAAGEEIVETTTFAPQFQPDRLAEIDTLRHSWDDRQVTIVDARSPAEFAGQEVRGLRGGHIPGAKHLEWKELLAEDGRFKEPAQLRELFQERGILPNTTAICH